MLYLVKAAFGTIGLTLFLELSFPFIFLSKYRIEPGGFTRTKLMRCTQLSLIGHTNALTSSSLWFHGDDASQTIHPLLVFGKIYITDSLHGLLPSQNRIFCEVFISVSFALIQLLRFSAVSQEIDAKAINVFSLRRLKQFYILRKHYHDP